MATTKRRRYSDEERATLVAMLISEGYPDKKGALQKVAEYAKVPHPTLHRWFKEKQNPPPSELVREKAFDLRKALQEELEAIFSVLPDARAEAEYKDLTRALGIITDKIFLLDGKATQRIELTWQDDAIAMIQRGELDRDTALEVFDGDNELVQSLFAKAALPVSTGTTENR